MSTHNFL